MSSGIWQTVLGSVGLMYGMFGSLGLLKKPLRQQEAEALVKDAERYAQSIDHWAMLEEASRAVLMIPGIDKLSGAEREVIVYANIRKRYEGHLREVEVRMKMLAVEEEAEQKAAKDRDESAAKALAARAEAIAKEGVLKPEPGNRERFDQEPREPWPARAKASTDKVVAAMGEAVAAIGEVALASAVMDAEDEIEQLKLAAKSRDREMTSLREENARLHLEVLEQRDAREKAVRDLKAANAQIEAIKSLVGDGEKPA